MKRIQLLTVITALTAAVGALAQVPSIINYQGRLSAGGTNLFNGPGQFKFALVNGGTNLNWQATAVATVSGGFLTIIAVTDGGHGYGEPPAVTIIDPTGSNAVPVAHLTAGVVTSITVPAPGRNYSPSPTVTIAPPPPNYAYVTYWSNDASSSGGGEPGQAALLLVNQGLFSVNLGDTGLSNMMAVIPPSIFTNSDVRLRIWFSDGVSAFQQFYPDQRLTAAGYAMMAAKVVDGAVDTMNIADGAITSSKLAPGLVSGIPNGMAVFTSSGTWTKPAEVSRVHVRLWGGGGGGGRYGGGGGGYCEGVIAVTGNVSVTAGIGGTGGPADGSGGSGGNSSFLSLIANGGVGGALASGPGGGASGGSLHVAGQNGWVNAGGNAAMGGGSGYPGAIFGGTFPGGGGAGGGSIYGPSDAGAPGLVIIYY